MPPRPPSHPDLPTPHECTQEHRLTALEHRQHEHSERIRKAEDALSDGRVEFAEIRKDLASIQATLLEIRAEMRKGPSYTEKAVDAAIHWGVPVGIIAVIWLLAKSGQVPGVQ